MNQEQLFRDHPEYRHPKQPPAKLKLTRPEPAEAAVLSSILAALNFYPRVVWAHRFNSGAYAVGEGSERRYIKFGFPGCPDILGMLKPRNDGEPGALLALEVKRPSGKATPEQTAFLDLVIRNGGCAGVVRSVDDLKVIIDKFHA